MNTYKEKSVLVGSKEHFAIRFALHRDPHNGFAATVEESCSWGAFEMWVNGWNLCQHLECSQTLPAVHWYLLPLLEWLTSNWDFILHEERLPIKSSCGNAWRALSVSTRPPANLDDEAFCSWHESWQNWWQRHSIMACREGGLFPSIIIRRWRDSIEISWGDEQITGCPNHYRFDLRPGYQRLDPQDVASILYEALNDAAQHLLAQLPESDRIKSLAENITRLKHSDHRIRLGLLCGIPPERNPDVEWDKIGSLFPGQADEILESVQDDLVVHGSCQAALMFGSLSPTVSGADIELLAKKLVELYSPEGDSPKLSAACRSVPLESSGDRAWTQGYMLAEELLESLDLPRKNEEWIDVEAIYKEFGIHTSEVRLDDRTIRAVAIASPHHTPTVLVNSNHTYQDPERWRFTLAHELCHLLHDRAYGARLAIASGPWAPADIEQRANAFAAMLLMPTDLVSQLVSQLSEPVGSESAIWNVANRMRTSFTATLDHLRNLQFIDEETRESLRSELDARAVRLKGTNQNAN